MHECQVAYPTQFPVEEIQNVIRYFRGGDGIDLACAAQCAWNVQGYAMSFIGHDHPQPIGATDVSSCNDEELAAKLDECQVQMKSNEMTAFEGVPPWLTPFLPLIAEAFKRILDRWLNS